MIRAVVYILGIWCAASLVGCRSNSRCELVEAELRTKDRELRELRERVHAMELMNQGLERELLHQHLPGGLPNHISGTLGPKDIQIGSGTGGVNDNRVLGSEALQVVVLPRDEDGNAVRAVGTLHIDAYEIQLGGAKTPLSSWDIGMEDLRRTWKNGLVGKGYHVVLPWKVLPTREGMRIVAQFRLPEGRILETDKDITIRPPRTAPVVPSPDPIPVTPIPVMPKGPPLLPKPQPEGPIISGRAAELLPPRISSYPNR